jgi:hypothetical protein
MTPASITDAGRFVVSFPFLQLLRSHNSPTTAPLSSGHVFLRSRTEYAQLACISRKANQHRLPKTRADIVRFSGRKRTSST